MVNYNFGNKNSGSKKPSKAKIYLVGTSSDNCTNLVINNASFLMKNDLSFFLRIYKKLNKKLTSGLRKMVTN